MTRLTALLATLLLVVTSAALAQGEDAQFFANVIASDVNGVLSECPSYVQEGLDPGQSAACFDLDSSEDLARLQLENALAGYSDIDVVGPWERSDDGWIVFRSWYYEPDDNFVAFGIQDVGEMFEVRVLVLVVPVD